MGEELRSHVSGSTFVKSKKNVHMLCRSGVFAQTAGKT